MFIKLFPLIALGVFLCRTLITGASIGDSIELSALSALYAYYLYLESKKEPEANKQLKDDVASLREQMGSLRSSLDSVKFGYNLKAK